MNRPFLNREVVGVAIIASLLVAVSIMPPWKQQSVQDQADPMLVRAEADDAFASENWQAASERYQRLMELDDAAADGVIWFRLGYALHVQGKLNEAIQAHRAASGYSRFAPTAKYNLACALALLGRKDHALQTLQTAIDLGFSSQMPIENDPDFNAIKGDPRFRVLAKKARPPINREIYRRFDFWVGRWRVMGPEGKQMGLSEVVRRERGFALIENWRSKSGATCVSLNFFDPSAKKWKQSRVDAGGNVIDYTGVWRDGKMVFNGEMSSVKGERTLSRMTIEPLTDGRVHQRIERSFDNGKSWSMYFDGHYERITNDGPVRSVDAPRVTDPSSAPDSRPVPAEPPADVTAASTADSIQLS